MSKERSICLFILGLFLFNAPFLKIFEGVFLYYFFFIWTLLIALLAIMASRAVGDKKE